MSNVTMRLISKDNWRTMVKVEAALLQGLDVAVETMAQMVKADIQSSWSGSSPSAIGSPPAVVTGVLNDGILVEKTGRNSKGQFAKDGAVRFIQFDTSASGDGQYASALEDEGYLDRPFIAPALERASDAFGGVIKTSVRWK